MPLPSHGRKRALIVNCYADETRRSVARAGKVPQTIGPVFLAGAFSPSRWDLRIHNEHSDGPLEDPALLGWPDVLVLTGLTTSLDRMRHVTAYARTRNPRVRVVGGGHVARAFPRFCATFMDVVCQGDVEELQAVLTELDGPGSAAEVLTPRFDLAHWIGRIGYAESTRYCNFACDFCVLTAERRRFAVSETGPLREQLLALGRRTILNFNDNNFYGSDRRSFLARVACVRERWEAGQFGHWGALVTGDFFQDAGNLVLVREAGAVALFSGVESFSDEWIASKNKKQNALRPQVEMIRECLDAGLVFLYGLILDLTTRPIAELHRELDAVFGCSAITLPAFLSLPIPFPGTPWFYQCLDAGTLMPATTVRDLDSTTITVRPVDPLAQAVAFVRDLQSARGYRRAIARHALAFAWRYRTRLSPLQMLLAQSGGLFVISPLLGTLPTRMGRASGPRTHVAGTEPLDRVYTPAFPVAARWAGHFEPVRLVEADGQLGPSLGDDIEAGRPAPRRTRADRATPPSRLAS
jgi:hypothetical protein